MFWNASAINGYAIEATDGSIGAVSDLLFDDKSWKVRWLVVDTGHWLPGRKVLLPPAALEKPHVGRREFPVKLSRQQVKDSPDLDADKSVSRQMEAHVYDYYGWDPYWSGGLYPITNDMAVPFPQPLALSGHIRGVKDDIYFPPEEGDPHLRSVALVTGYHVHASDGEIGHVEDFLIDDADWSIPYIIVDTNNWWPGKQVILLPRLVDTIDWSDRLFNLKVKRDIVKKSPPYHRTMTVDGAFNADFMGYYTAY